MVSQRSHTASRKLQPLQFGQGHPFHGVARHYAPDPLSPPIKQSLDKISYETAGYAEITQQGRLERVKVSYPVPQSEESLKRPQRGLIAGFSKRSRKRFIEEIQRLDSVLITPLEPKFLTLTYRYYVDIEAAKANLRALFERLRRRWPQSSGYWRIELQKRGVWHFHIILFGLPFIPQRNLQEWWEDIVGYDHVKEGSHLFVNIKCIDSVKQLTNYVAKYAAKIDDSSSLLDNVSYLHVGRWWGKYNAACLPYAAVVKMKIPMGQWFFKVRRVANKIYKGIKKTNQYGIKGFTVYLDQSARLFDWIQDLFMEGRAGYAWHYE